MSVEPDPNPETIKRLLYNRDRFGCNFAVAHGTVSDVALASRPGDSSVKTRFHPVAASRRAHGSLSPPAQNFAVDGIERRIGSRFNAALIDCEGCIPHLAATGLLDRLALVLIEEDYAAGAGWAGEGVPYAHWRRYLHKRGFVNVWHASDAFSPSLGKSLRHLAWRRGTGEDECMQHRARAGLSAEALSCLPLVTKEHIEAGTLPGPHLGG